MNKLAGVGLVAFLVCCGCGRELQKIASPNRPPEVTVEHEALAGTATSYSCRVRWTARDPDGRIDHYLVATDPASLDRVDGKWIRTHETARVLDFPKDHRVATSPSERPAPHIFVVRAVDEHGEMSEPAYFAVNEGNLPPSVVITSPRPSSLLVPRLAPTVRVVWSGHDPDGVNTTRPVKYKYILLTPSSVFRLETAIANPDSLRRYYAPHFLGWDSTSTDTTEAWYYNLWLDGDYLFVVTAFDEVGDYDPVFTLDKNMLRFRVGDPRTIGRTITVYNEFFNNTWRPGYNKSPEAHARIEAPAGQPLTFNWTAIPSTGASSAGFRWVLDPVVLDDETPRSSPADIRHWSEWSLATTSATVGPFPAIPKGEVHRLYVEARDDLGFKNLAVVQFTVTGPPAGLRQTLLIVRDTRLKPDNRPRTQQCVEAPRGPWPSTAELDTFLFASGGVTWRPTEDDTPSPPFPRGPCPDGYPVGTMSSPGLFAGYYFDTLGTRTGKMDLTVPLSTLRRYDHVIWIVDPLGATFDNGGTDLIAPGTALRYMSDRGRFNTLAAYIKSGGKAWVMGGGAAFATSLPWNRSSNDQPTITFSSLTTPPDLGPGRFMYEIAHWRSAYRSQKLPAVVARFAGRWEQGEHPDPAHYTRYLGELPARPQVRTRTNTPILPPTRTNQGDYYPVVTALEYLISANSIIEDVGGDPKNPRLESTLDTLYEADGGGLPGNSENPHNVCMTYYQGPSIPHGFVFTGLTPWDYYRPHAQAMVDFVLQRMWGLQRIQSPETARAHRVAGRIGSPSGTSRTLEARGRGLDEDRLRRRR